MEVFVLNAVNLSLNSNNSDNNDEEVIIDSTSDNTSSIVSKKSLQNKIKNQLNLVRREYKEKFYNQETPLNKDDLLNTKRKTKNKYDRCNITENINQTKNVLIAGDSLLYGVDEQRLSNKYNVKVRCFPGATISDMFDYLKPLFKNNPESVIIHIGTNNDSTKSSSRELLDKMLELKLFISSNLPTSKVIISSPVLRTDNGKAMLTLKNLNKLMKELKINIIDNDNIKEQHLGRKGLHLNGKGTSRLAMNFIEMLKTTSSTQ